MHRISLSYLLILIVAVTLSYAYPSPTDPYGATVWNSGQQVTITWTDSGSPSTSTFTGITVQLMTGPDLQQIPLTTLADKLPTSATSLSITVPDISKFGYPPGKIYFLQFSNSAKPGVGISWTTRFTILDGSNQTPVTYTPGTPWTITPSSGGNPTAAPSSNITASTTPTSINATTTDPATTSSSTSNSSTTALSSSLSGTVVVTAFTTNPNTATTTTGASANTPIVNANPDVNASSSSSLITSVWNGGIITMFACVAFAFVI